MAAAVTQANAQGTAIANGKAVVNFGQLASGSHTLTTTYFGDANFAAATETPVSFTVSDLSFTPSGTQAGTFFKTVSFTNPAGVPTHPRQGVFVQCPK